MTHRLKQLSVIVSAGGCLGTLIQQINEFLLTILLSRGHQKISLRANWIWRGGVANVVICPAVGPVKTAAFGRPRLARLKRLKNSARNSESSFSLILVCFMIEKSTFTNAGP